MDIVKELLALQDLEYKAHSSKINPTVPQETIIGVRIPKLRRLAKTLLKAAKQADKSEITQVNAFSQSYLTNILKRIYCTPF